MDKVTATARLGNEESAARWIGVSLAVYREWPARLHPVMRDRVYAAVLRRDTAKAMGIPAKQWFADARNEIFVEAVLERISIVSVVASLQETISPEFARQREHNEPDAAGRGGGRRRSKRDDDKELSVEGLA